jgi:hypothetical protein
MKQVDNEDDLSFIHIAAATADVVRWLSKENQNPEHEKRPADRDTGEPKKEDPEKERRYIEQRLRDIAALERGFTKQN